VLPLLSREQGTALQDAQSLLDQALLNQETATSNTATVTAILPKTSLNSPAARLHFWPGAEQVTAAIILSPNMHGA